MPCQNLCYTNCILGAFILHILAIAVLLKNICLYDLTRVMYTQETFLFETIINTLNVDTKNLIRIKIGNI